MADNVGYTPGSGATVAADDIGGVLYQRVKPVVGEDGSANDISQSNPMPIAGYGELIEALESMRFGINSMLTLLPRMDSSLRVRAVVDSGTVSVNSVTTVTTCSTVTNASQLGGLNAISVPMALLTLSADNLRRNISVT